MREHHLDLAVRPWPPVPGLGAQRQPDLPFFVQPPGPADVTQERLAVMAEADLLAEPERLDGRVTADSGAFPPPEQEASGSRSGCIATAPSGHITRTARYRQAGRRGEHANQDRGAQHAMHRPQFTASTRRSRAAPYPAQSACPGGRARPEFLPCPPRDLSSSRSPQAKTTRNAATRPSRSPRPRPPAAFPSRCGSPASPPGSASPGRAGTSRSAGRAAGRLAGGVLAAGSVTVCTQCAARRNIEPGDLIDGIRIAGAATFVAEVMTEGAQALVYRKPRQRRPAYPV